jgi:hypothetical protein
MARPDGVSARTKKGLVESGAMTPEDVGGRSKPVKAAPVKAEPPPRGISKQVAQPVADKMLKEQLAKRDKNYAAWVARGKK